jgi:hypothetical protein
LFLARHRPLALGGLCMRCAQPVGKQARSFVEAEGGARGVVHADCADRFSLGRTRNAMAALERLGVVDLNTSEPVKFHPVGRIQR